LGFIFVTPRERIDATAIPREALPHIWRDRFYINDVFNDLVNKNTGYSSLVGRLARATRMMYRERQIQMNQSPAIRTIGFEPYTWKPDGEPADTTSPAGPAS